MQRRRILVVTPCFPPANGADMHRVRATVPFFRDHGWDVEVLSVAPEQLSVPQDPWLEAGTPEHVTVHRCHGLPLSWSRVPGLGTIDFRVRSALKKFGARLMSSNRYDLVYFSTTAFGLLAVARIWKQQFGVPFVIDYQDPWVTDYYRETGAAPPGGWLKYSVVSRLARYEERRVLAECSGITAVSPAYPTDLRKRYSFMADTPDLVIPFPGVRRDFDRVQQSGVRQTVFDPQDGSVHWVYVGVSSPSMYKALGAFFAAVQAEREAGHPVTARLKLHFIGTSYAALGKGQFVVRPLAERYGIEDLVHEQPDRIPYSQALKCLLDADALITPGSDDPTYNASKLLPNLMARRPVLTIFHDASPTSALVREIGGATLIPFESDDSEATIVNRIRDGWFRNGVSEQVMPFDEAAAQQYTDRGQAEILCRFFGDVVGHEACAERTAA